MPSSGWAQRQTLTATIPFSFSFGDKEMPRGEYRILVSDHGIVQLRSDRGEVWALARSAEPESRNNGALVFRRYGDLYFLAKIAWLGAAVEMPQSKIEREVAKNFHGTPKLETAAAK
jgi:hypothetical protein